MLNVQLVGRAHGPHLSLLAGKDWTPWGRNSDTYFRNMQNYSLVIQSKAARDMVMASNMAAIGVEVQGASIR